MHNSKLSEDEIFFGFIFPDSSRSSMIRRQPTKTELEELWAAYPSLFSHRCTCGSVSYNYSHIVRTSEADPHVVSSSIVSFICRDCGHRVDLGANYHFSQIRNRIMNNFLTDGEQQANPLEVVDLSGEAVLCNLNKKYFD